MSSPAWTKFVFRKDHVAEPSSFALFMSNGVSLLTDVFSKYSSTEHGTSYHPSKNNSKWTLYKKWVLILAETSFLRQNTFLNSTKKVYRRDLSSLVKIKNNL